MNVLQLVSLVFLRVRAVSTIASKPEINIVFLCVAIVQTFVLYAQDCLRETHRMRWSFVRYA
jgi:hypothetical protein